MNLVWRNALGVVYPSEATVAVPPGEHFPTGESAALPYRGIGAHPRARGRRAARRNELGRERTARELQATTLRLRALERRWIPEHERALHEVELALDESEREESARVRWVIRRLSGPGRPSSGRGS